MNGGINNDIIQLTKDEFLNIDDVAQRLTQLDELFRQTKDNRGIFIVAYKDMTIRLREKIRLQKDSTEKVFNNTHWLEQYLLAFANLYRKALYGSVKALNIPEAWRIAFEKADDDRGVISLQHLMLGINAHIAHDLPLALYQTGVGTREEQKHKKMDHDKVNDVLREATNSIQNKVTRYHLSQGFSILEKILGPFDEWITQFYFEKQREQAWYNALHLTYLSKDEPVDSYLRDWFAWALQSTQSFTSFETLLRQIDLKALDLAQVITTWKLPKVPGFREDVTFDEFERVLTDQDLEQLEAEIEGKKKVAETETAWDWTKII